MTLLVGWDGRVQHDMVLHPATERVYLNSDVSDAWA